MSKLIHNILEYNLLSIQDYTFTVYDLLRLFIYFLIAKTILWLIKKALDRKWKFKKLDHGSQYALYQIITYIIWVIAIVLALESVGVKVTILIAGSAALLVGIGLGLQQTFNDIISGIILLVEGSIKVGDILEVDGNVVRVKKIGLRTSIVEDRSEIVVILPNSKIVTDKVINWTYNYERARFTVSVGVAYGTNVDLVLKILIESAAEHPLCNQEKKPFARLVNFGDSSLGFEVYFWCHEMFGIDQVKSDIRKTISKKFDEHGIVIPFPQRDLHFKSSQIDFPEK
jgi:small-conductance mechanosensitive channel